MDKPEEQAAQGTQDEDKQEKQAAQGTQDEDKQSTSQYVFDTTICKQTQIK